MKEIDHTKPRTLKDKIKFWFCVRKPLYKNWWLYPPIVLLFLLLVVGIPIAINEAYKVGEGYITMWGAADVLSFYAVILSGIISISALIVTIYHSKRETDRQLRFYMGQSKAPFFIIDRIAQSGSKRKFRKNESRQWIKEYVIPEPGKLEAGEDGHIEIIVKNIGDGLALEPSYQVDMFASTIIPDNVIEKDKHIVLTYDLQRNLNDKYVNHHFVDGFANISGGGVIHYTRIKLNYQNMLGIELHQQILVELVFDFGEKNFTLRVNELSPQTGLG